MSSWSKDDLRMIEENDDSFVSPFREDGTTYGTRPNLGGHRRR
jgi:hypothetical protein